ncbi:MAG: hypothetical protein WC708_00120 [Lentisphaeria bacterium]|jgi:hypothetical protein
MTEDSLNQKPETVSSVKEVLDAIQDCLTVTVFRNAGLSGDDAITAQTVAREIVERVEEHFSKKLKV